MKTKEELNALKEEVELKDTELEAVTGGTEPVEWIIPENGLPRPNGRYPEPEHNVPTWTPNTNEETGLEIPKPGTYEIYGVAWGQD